MTVSFREQFGKELVVAFLVGLLSLIGGLILYRVNPEQGSVGILGGGATAATAAWLYVQDEYGELPAIR